MAERKTRGGHSPTPLGRTESIMMGGDDQVAQALFPDHEAPIQLHGQPDQGSKLGIDMTRGGAGEVNYMPSSRQGSVRSFDPSSPTTPVKEQRGANTWNAGHHSPVDGSGAGARPSPAIMAGTHLHHRNGANGNGNYGALGNGHPQNSNPDSSSSPRPRARSAQVAEPADWHAIATNGHAAAKGRSSSLAVPPPLPETPPSGARRSTAPYLELPSPAPPVPVIDYPSIHPSSSRLPSRSYGGISHSASVSSTLSAATSNSSNNNQRAPPAPHTTPHPASGACFNSATDPDGVAALVQQLYARLDDQGVYGDGWDEGKERSRDGIILRLDPDRDLSPKSPQPHPHQLAIPNDPDLAAKADKVLRRVDR